MSAQRTERLVNLVICLLSTRAYLTAARIREVVPGYQGSSDEAFKRTFERDKSDLRELSVPLETGRSSVFETEDGYRIARRDYELPEVRLEPDEAAAVGLAARLWASAGLADAARSALVKLRAAGVQVDAADLSGIEPRVDATEPAFADCLAAVRSRQPITFGYRGRRTDPVLVREVEPWGAVSVRGRWYLVGKDRMRDAKRCFRLSRIEGPPRLVGTPGEIEVPGDVDLVQSVLSTVPHRAHSATVRVAAGRAAGLRRIGAPAGGAGDEELLQIDFSDTDWLADTLTGYGADVVVLDPPELRDAVMDRLRALAAVDPVGASA